MFTDFDRSLWRVSDQQWLASRQEKWPVVREWCSKRFNRNPEREERWPYYEALFKQFYDSGELDVGINNDYSYIYTYLPALHPNYGIDEVRQFLPISGNLVLGFFRTNYLRGGGGIIRGS